MTWLALLLTLMFPRTVRGMGYCPDVSSPTCAVRDYWPTSQRAEATGKEAYWLMSVDRQICFVDRSTYDRAIIGRETDCIWRYRQP